MKVLFLSRKFPPRVGGMEQHSFHLLHALGAGGVDVRPLVLRRSQIHLVWWLPWALLRGLMLARRVDLIYVADGLLAPLAWVLGFVWRKPAIATVHGLDVTYRNFLYQLVNVSALRRLDAVIAVSDATREELIRRGFRQQSIFVVANGVDVSRFANSLSDKQSVADIIFTSTGKRVSPHGKRILFSAGRLIRRKGFTWFLAEVFSALPPEYIYCIAGSGSERQHLEALIEEHGWQDRVFLLGRVSDAQIGTLFFAADVFIMPNIAVTGDAEGFGIVALEAAACGLPVLAANIDGLPAAIHDGKNGWLVPSGAARAWQEAVVKYSERGAHPVRAEIAAYTKKVFSWEQRAKQYEDIFKKITR